MASLLTNILDPIFGSDTSGTDAQAEDALRRGMAAYQGTNLPNLQVPDPSMYQDIGQYQSSLVSPTLMGGANSVNYNLGAPQLASNTNQQSSAYNDISTDPRLAADQMGALSALQGVAANGGLTAADKANLANIQSNEAQSDKARRDAILQGEAAKGMGSSGNSLLAQLASSQSATDRQSQSDLGVAGQAQQNALSAQLGAGNLAGQIQGQQFGQQAQQASAQDAINRFNSQNLNSNSLANAQMSNQAAYQQAQGGFNAQQANAANQMETARFNAGQGQQASAQNAGILNNAAQYNAGARQNVANANTGVANQTAQQRYYQLPQQQYQNQMNKNAGIAGQGQSLGNYYDQLGNRATAKDAGYMSAVLQGAGAAAGYSNQADANNNYKARTAAMYGGG